IGTLGISKDISQRVELERQLRRASITDNLTGLYNQRHFHELLSQETERARRQRQKLSILLLDLDGFKAINDSRGHMAGDRILRDFRAMLRRGTRRQVDAAFRYGGDEFVLLMPGISGRRAQAVATRLTAAAKRTFKGLPIGFSYGVASLPPCGSGAELLKAA